MKKIALFSGLLLLGLWGSQTLPILAPGLYSQTAFPLKILAMLCLAFIMIHVGLELDRDEMRALLQHNEKMMLTLSIEQLSKTTLQQFIEIVSGPKNLTDEAKDFLAVWTTRTFLRSGARSDNLFHCERNQGRTLA
jgi:hypothetical protein